MFVTPGPAETTATPIWLPDARVRVRHVPGGLLVADVDDADLLVDTAVVDRPDMAAVEAEDHLDAPRSEGLGDERSAVRVCVGVRDLHRAS